MVWFREGGWAMWAVLAADLGIAGFLGVGLLAAVVARFVPALVWPARGLAALGLLALATPVVFGAIGWWSGWHLVDDAIRMAEPSVAELIRAQGYAEARIPLQFGLGSGVAGLLPALAVLAVAALPRRMPAEG